MENYVLVKKLNGNVKLFGDYETKERVFGVLVKDFFTEINNNIDGEIFEVNNNNQVEEIVQNSDMIEQYNINDIIKCLVEPAGFDILQDEGIAYIITPYDQYEWRIYKAI